MAESEEELRPFRWGWKSKRAGLKLNIKKTQDHDVQPHSSMATEGGKVEVVTGVLFLALKSMQTVIAAMKSEGDCCLAGTLRQTWTVCGKAETLLCYKSLGSQGYDLPRSHVQLWELGCKEGRTPKNWYLWTVVLESSPVSPLNSKEIKLVNLKGNQPWILFGRMDAEAETPIYWSSDANSWLIRKVPDAGNSWGQMEKRVLEDEMAGWHHQCNGHELGQTSGDEWGTRRPGVLQSMGSQRTGHKLVTE